MRPPWGLVAFLVAGCAGGAVSRSHLVDDPGTHSVLAEEDRYTPSYGKAELSKALIAERGAEATAERIVAELDAKDVRDAAADDRLRVAAADLAVRRRFIATLEACEATGQWCPPRLDDPPWAFDPDPDQPAAPPVDAPLRFDLESWRKLAAELHGRACACRTIACIDSVGAAIDHLEPKPIQEIQGDHVASQSITRGRECLFRLRGKSLPSGAPRGE